jgi:hypothetical protein
LEKRGLEKGLTAKKSDGIIMNNITE